MDRDLKSDINSFVLISFNELKLEIANKNYNKAKSLCSLVNTEECDVIYKLIDHSSNPMILIRKLKDII